MGEALQDAVKWAPGFKSLFRFGGLNAGLFSFILVCLNAYIKGIALGYTFRDKYDMLMLMLVESGKEREYADNLCNLVEQRINNYHQEIISIIDFFIITELAQTNLSFNEFLRKAKTKVKIEYMGPRLKIIFEEAISLGANYPEIVSRVISSESKTSSLDWEKAKILGYNFNTNNLELDLEVLQKWARHNLGIYVREHFPKLVKPLQITMDYDDCH